MEQHEGQRAERPVAVWLMDGDWGEPDDPIRLLRAITHLSGGDFEFACRVADGTDLASARPWKACIAGPVSHEAAAVIVRWIEAEGWSSSHRRWLLRGLHLRDRVVLLARAHHACSAGADPGS
jgi:hypothetical protein